MKKHMGKIIIATIVIVAGSCYLPFPMRLDETVHALEWRLNDESYSKPVTIGIKGIYYNYLFRTDRFEGDFVIEGYPYTAEAEPIYVSLYDGAGFLMYHDRLDFMTSEVLGHINATPEFREFTIDVLERIDETGKSWQEDNGLMITGYATTREEAVEKTNHLKLKRKKVSTHSINN